MATASSLDAQGANCTINFLKAPSFQTDCTFYQETSTSTAYTECNGCALHTRKLGLGFPCKTLTTVPGTAYQNVTSCSSSYSASTTAAPSLPAHSTNAVRQEAPCTRWVLPSMRAINGCHAHPGTVTKTFYTKCDACVTSTLHLGPGPVVPPCTSTVMDSAYATVTVAACGGKKTEKTVR
ncbi:hypothetical protein EJ04DRAFT_429090 [Polyplosphaeria fusca]|uniref:Uncharacterized protein n=1 Tax=Polyplosphaeria fusca TaxID=682080 RepID=A0A9P4R3G9_9PLEO|nr:hypothetical protein EJ04DRAFT_429090 [Polyplosphaeria fusca]